MKKILALFADLIVVCTAAALGLLLATAIMLVLISPANAEAQLYPVAYVDVNADSYLAVRQTPGGKLTPNRLLAYEDVVILAVDGDWALVIQRQYMGCTDMRGIPLGWAHTEYLHIYAVHIGITKEPAAATADPNALTTDYPLIVA